MSLFISGMAVAAWVNIQCNAGSILNANQHSEIIRAITTSTGLILGGTELHPLAPRAEWSSISITIDRESIVADYLSYRWRLELGIRHGQLILGFLLNPLRIYGKLGNLIQHGFCQRTH